MNLYFSPKIKELASKLPAPLYAVGGYVRNFLIDGSLAEDVDLCAPISVDELKPYLDALGLKTVALYKRTGTVVFACDKIKYEFTSFRKDEYLDGGAHSPEKTSPTDDINEDARRRDFKCNAVYYDIARDKIVDPLNGVEDIKNKVLDTVTSAERVFGHDGLRLLRLARFCGELNFKPTGGVKSAMRRYADNIKDISAERVYDELKKILVSDTKYSFSDRIGHYTGLKILDETRVLDRILPELTLGRDMEQRRDYHDYDVLEHSLRVCMYAPPRIRLVALLHDIAKPYCNMHYGRYLMHPIEGAPMSANVLKRLKADNKTVKTVSFLVGAHMYDLDGDLPKAEVRKFIVKNREYVDDLLLLKQADHCGYKDDLSLDKTVKRWRSLTAEMEVDGTPLKLKELKITAEDLIENGVEKQNLGKALSLLWDKTIENPLLNDKSRLLDILKN